MTTFYSNHYSAEIGSTGHFTTLSPNKVVPSYARGASVRRSEARMLVPSGQDLADDDVIRFMDFKTGDRLLELYFSMDADWGATTTFNIGFYAKGTNNDGAVIDEDLFVTAVDWAGAITRVEYFKESTTLADYDRGKTLWELAVIGGATYTQDPFEVWTLTAQCSQNISATAAAVSFLCEAYYIAGV